MCFLNLFITSALIMLYLIFLQSIFYYSNIFYVVYLNFTLFILLLKKTPDHIAKEAEALYRRCLAVFYKRALIFWHIRKDLISS